MYKLFNNCIYGKSIENPRKKINVKMINDKKKYRKIVNKPNFISQKINDKNLVAVDCSKKILTLNKPMLCWYFRTFKVVNVSISL